MYATMNGQVEVVGKLLQHGASVDLLNRVCYTFINLTYSLHSILLTDWSQFTDSGVSEWTCGGG